MTSEEHLAKLLRLNRAVVALGQPGERAPQLGAVRYYPRGTIPITVGTAAMLYRNQAHPKPPDRETQ